MDTEPNNDGERPPTARKTRSQEEMEERVFYTAQLLSQFATKGEVKREMKLKWGVSARTCETYLARAREQLDRWAKLTKTEVRDQVATVLMGLLTTGRHGDKLATIDRIMRMWGLEAPYKVAPTSPDGEQEWYPSDDDRNAIYTALATRLGLPAHSAGTNGQAHSAGPSVG